eukprot:1250351-Alexandrium_andersonii.AAC.1
MCIRDRTGHTPRGRPRDGAHHPAVRRVGCRGAGGRGPWGGARAQAAVTIATSSPRADSSSTPTGRT